jgi:hypothetical protein
MSGIKKTAAVVALGLVVAFGVVVVDPSTGPAVADPKPCC